MNHISCTIQPKQGGYVLLTTLILTFMLAVLSVTQISLNGSQVRVATNATDTEIIFEKTEGALSQAISLLKNGTYVPISFFNNNNGLYIADPTAAPLWTTVDWSNALKVINGFQGSTGYQASYIVEQLPAVIQPGQNFKTPVSVYRVTARALGSTGNSSVVLQTTLQIQ